MTKEEMITYEKTCMLEINKQRAALACSLKAVSDFRQMMAKHIKPTGVAYNINTGKWHARAHVNGCCSHVGTYEDIEEAIGARTNAIKKLHEKYG